VREPSKKSPLEGFPEGKKTGGRYKKCGRRESTRNFREGRLGGLGG